MTRPTHLTVSALERRDQPSVFGNPWPNANRLTMSFANNGVSYSNQTWGSSTFTSNLFGELNGSMAQSVWQEELLRAVYAWTAQANVNVGLVPDSGRAFGPAGFSVTGPAAADLRVGAFDQSPEVLATSIPYHPLTGSHAGNMMLNGAKTFTKGGANGTADLYSVALHETANLLGLADNEAEAGSARNGTYTGVRTGLTAGDVTAVRNLYGPRATDAFEGSNGNNTFARASLLTPATDPANAARRRVVADGNITAVGDVDVYRFTTPSGTTSATIRLGTAGRSLLAGKVELIRVTDLDDNEYQVLATQTSTNPLTGDTVLTASGLNANATYYVRVTAGRSDVFAVGTYQLRVGFNYDPVTETQADPVQRLGADGGANNTLATATTLTPTAGSTLNNRYSASARVESIADHDFYKLTAPSTSGVMTISAQGLQGLQPKVTVYTAAGAVVASNVLLNWENGLYRAQAGYLDANTTYFLKVEVADPDWSAWSGDYFLDVDFKQPLAARDSVAGGTATQDSRIAYGFEIGESRAFTFALHAVSTNTAAVNWFTITVYSSTGEVAASLGTDGLGSVDTLTAFLKKGKYTIVFDPVYTRSSSATVLFSLSAALISDPIDVYDPTVPPPPPASPPPPPFTTAPLPPASPVPPGYYDPWGNPIP
jgi:hypothetical protein